jgi:hypothetical protein
MYADTWPHLDKFWEMVFGPHLVGRLGLFHFMQRIVKTLRDSHIDYRFSIWKLRECFYEYETGDLESLMQVLKSGKMDRRGHKYTSAEITALQLSGKWKQRYDKWLRKRLFPPEKMKSNLIIWWTRFKVENSAGEPPGKGRVDPYNMKKLFTPDTQKAVEEAKKSCEFIGDEMGIEDMYTTLPATKNSTHGLREYISHRVESRLEQFHDPLSNYANSGMRAALADTLHLAGTARYNSAIRQKIGQREYGSTKDVPSHLSSVPPYFNHVHLSSINAIAKELGLSLPFEKVRELPPDNGERFFSQYLESQNKRNLEVIPHHLNDRCQCEQCACNSDAIWHEIFSERLLYNPYTKTTLQVAKARKTLPSSTLRQKNPAITESTNMVNSTTKNDYPVALPSKDANDFSLSLRQNNPISRTPWILQPPSGLLMYGSNFNPPQISFPSARLNFSHPYHHPQFYYPMNFNILNQGHKPQTEDCCAKRAYHRINKRKGRPPHDLNCSYRYKVPKLLEAER